MKTRISQSTITFKRAFFLGRFDEKLPAGDYIVETEEELLDGTSLHSPRRKSTLLYLHGSSSRPGRQQALPINPRALDAALLRDQATEGI